MIKYNKLLITLTGHTCSGKNYFLEKVIADFGYNKIVSCTTRPRREGEVEGDDYYFISRNEFDEIKYVRSRCSEFIECVTVGEHYYGVTEKEFDDKVTFEVPAIIILTPQGVNQYVQICDNKRVKMISFFIDTPQKIRKERFIKRALIELQNKNANDVITSMLDRYEQMIINERYWDTTEFLKTGNTIILDGSDLDWALETFVYHIKQAKRELNK